MEFWVPVAAAVDDDDLPRHQLKGELARELVVVVLVGGNLGLLPVLVLAAVAAALPLLLLPFTVVPVVLLPPPPPPPLLPKKFRSVGDRLRNPIMGLPPRVFLLLLLLPVVSSDDVMF